MFVPWVVTGEAASTTPGRHPTPNPTRALASRGGNSPPATGPAPRTRRSAAPSPATATAGSPTSGSRTARSLTHHHRRPRRHGRGGAGGDRRGVGGEV